MTPERWNLVTGLFHRVLEYAPDDRGAFLDAECPDAEVRLEVEALLSEFADDDPFLETRHREAAIGAVFHEVRQVAAGVAPGYVLDDKYRIEALLGRGGMGAVYRATQLHIDRQVAVKLLLEPVRAGNLALSRFKREAFAVASLRHRNIVALYDFGIADEAGAYLVMEYLEGESLREALTRRGPLDVELAIGLVRQTCAALCVVHATGTVHRDLKPDNIFLKRGDDGPTVKILDFGVAKLPGRSSVLTQEGVAIGTPSYMAPEQCEGRGADARSDIYALGCILYEMLTGRPPFTGETTAQVMYQHIYAVPPAPRARRPEINPALERVVLHALAKKPDERFASAEEMDAALAGASGCASTADSSAIDAPALGSNTGELFAATVVDTHARPTLPPSNIPETATSFIGRQREVEEAVDLLANARLLTLAGPGGIGKTRLALTVAGRVLPEYRDGVWIVDLAPLADPAQVPAAIATGVGVREEPGRPLIETLASTLKTRRMLLVLDNCEHVVDGAARAIVAILRTSHFVRVLATSRELLGVDGEEVFVVPPLAVAGVTTTTNPLHGDAARLFVERARLVRPGFTPDDRQARAVAELCQRLDGIPLAIELAAARTKMLSVEQILARLEDRFRLLVGGSRTTAARQQTLRAAIDWSYALLTPDERLLFARLAIFAGSWSLEATGGACAGDGIDELAVMDLLERLVDKSLVVTEEAELEMRYRMLETIRQYAREKLAESGEEQRRLRAHTDWYAGLAVQAWQEMRGPRQSEASTRVEVEYDNLRAALRWSIREARDVEASLRLAGSLSIFWYRGSRLTEGRQWIEEALALGSSLSSPAATPEHRSAALYGLSLIASAQSDYRSAKAAIEECIELRRQLGDWQGLAQALNSHVVIANSMGDYEAGLSIQQEGLAVCRAHGLTGELSHGLYNLGEIAFAAGDLEHARACLEEGIEGWRSSGHFFGVAAVLGKLGHIAWLQGDFDRAWRFVEEYGEIARRLNANLLVLNDYILRASLLGDQGDTSGAMKLLAAAVRNSRTAGAWEIYVAILECCAFVAAQSNRPERTVCLAEAANRLRETYGVPRPRVYQLEIARRLAVACVTLTESEIARARAEGHAMTLDAALDYAVGPSSGMEERERTNA